jgi:hypothetical protein
MRLPEEKIKQAILHPDAEVREMAVCYFANSFSLDPTVMPLVVQAVEKYGYATFPGRAAVGELSQTDETLLWTLAELAREGHPQGDSWRNYRSRLHEMLVGADAQLLAKHDSAIAAAEGLDEADKDAIAERIRLLSADPDTCWAALQDFCEREKAEYDIREVDLDHAYRLVEAIARHGERCGERVLSILAEEVEDYTDHPMGWLEPLVVRLAGAMRLEAAIPLIVDKMHDEDGGDLLREECERALQKLGTDAAVEAVSANFSECDRGYRLSAAAVLECVHSDLVVAKAIELLSQEESGDVRIWLGHVLLRQFAAEGIESLRQLILAGPLDPDMRDLRKDLLTACALMEASFPEMDRWREDAEHDTEANRAFFFKQYPALGKLPALIANDVEEDEEDLLYGRREPTAKQKTGRNDPCPCGSGKKFKKCCLKK